MSSASLIADPSGNPDRKTELEVGVELVGIPLKAVGHAANQRLAVFPQNRQEIIVCITLVQEDRFPHSRGQLELAMKSLLLHRSRREVAKIVEPTFARRHDLGETRKLLELAHRFLRQLGRMVGMDAGRCVQLASPGLGKLYRLARAFEARPRNDHLDYSHFLGTSDHRVPVDVVTVVAEIDSDVDERERGGRGVGYGMVWHAVRAFY